MKISIVLLAFIFTINSFAQVGIGTATPNASSALEINSTTKGLLLPRMSHDERNAIVAPVAGLVIWCSNCGASGQIQVYDGTCWTDMLGGTSAGFAVGDCYGGGKVAYILQPGDPGYVTGELHGLIAAPGDQSTGSNWGCNFTELPGADGVLLGTGSQNSLDIVMGCFETGAARICYDFVLGGYSDWFLPSRDELNKLYLNRVAIGGFANENYWCSSEVNVTNAWGQQFLTGAQSISYGKYYANRVRAVRTF